MFDVGFWEILLILVLALVIIGPERLPGAARKAGYFVGKARRYIEGVRTEVESELDISEFKRMLHNQEVQINELQQQLKAGVDEVRSEMPAADTIPDSSTHSFHEVSPDGEAGNTPEVLSENLPKDSDQPVTAASSSVTQKEKL
jgi:sec-independent protein translocase protein TatB